MNRQTPLQSTMSLLRSLYDLKVEIGLETFSYGSIIGMVVDFIARHHRFYKNH
jgi:hypothetical protein